MPFINGKFYMNPAYDRAVEDARDAEAPSQSDDSIKRAQPDGDGHWVTINHHHVLIDADRGQTASRPRERMSLSPRGLDFIKRHERFRGQPYPDITGRHTIGYGHLIKPGENFGRQITPQQASDLLRQDVRRAENEVNAALKVPVTQNQFDALTSIAFNAGPKAVAPGNTLLSKINQGRAVQQSDFTAYNKARMRDGSLAVSPGLTNRRLDEYEIFSTGNYKGSR